jgi:hypothetical protein
VLLPRIFLVVLIAKCLANDIDAQTTSALTNRTNAPNAANAVALPLGPHLFIDDYLVASASNVVRRPVTLVREALSAAPILTSEKYQTFQPFFTVLRDPATGTFRMWYGIPSEDFSHVRSRIAYIESPDGIHWTNAPRILDIGPIQFGSSVIDEGPGFSPPDRRYKLGWYMDNGLRIATSADGLAWTHLTNGIVLAHNHDINGIFYDTLRSRYTAIVSFHVPGPNWTGNRRITKQSFSQNLLNWSEPSPVLTPDARDEGETQFYAMDGFLTRGNLLLGMVKVLRDDLKADNPPEPPDAYGIGYTTLAWTRDGQQWTRERVPLLDRNARKGTWDHAHAWVDEQVPVGEEVYVYYAGYQSGHKVNRFKERQIGLIKMKRDRYVAREAKGEGVLRTPPVVLAGRSLSINADADGGEVRVQILTAEGKPIRGLSFHECKAVREDSIHAPVRWRRSIREVGGQPVVLEFKLTNAALYGFELE